MKRLRVLQLGSPTGMYGAERWILALIRHLDPEQVESTVGVINDEPGTEAPLLAHAQKLGFGTMAIDAPGRVNLSAVWKLRKYILANDIDILHTHFYKTDLVGLLATRGTRCRIVTTPHGWSTDAGTALRIYEALDRFIFRWFDAVVPLSDELHSPLRGRAGAGLHLIRNGVDISEVDAVTALAPEALQWQQRGDFVIGYIGQLIARKGLDVLVQAFARSKLRRKRLVLVGDGPQRPELEALVRSLGVAECTEFHGFRGDRLALLKGFDVFVLPSRLEGIPRCLMEAMAAGVPLVVSDIPGSRELVAHGATGLAFPVDDVEELRTLLDSCASGDLRRRLAASARTLVVESYSAQSMSRAYAGLYEHLVSPPGRPAPAGAGPS